jgi:hypothetical protein
VSVVYRADVRSVTSACLFPTIIIIITHDATSVCRHRQHPVMNVMSSSSFQSR